MKDQLFVLLQKMASARVLVIGDVMIDVYINGQVVRLAQEAPVPVFVEAAREARMGGAGNVATQLKALGIHTVESWTPGARTHKFRYFHDHHLVFRHDENVTTVPSERECAKAASLIQAEGVQAVILSDYARGWVSAQMCRAVIAEAQLRGIPVVVDPKGPDWSKYWHAAAICPNQKEWEENHSAHSSYDKPVWPFPVLRKCGEEGLVLMQRGKEEVAYPASARRVYDVTGAGDTVTALVAAGLAVGASLPQCAVLANLAAGHVVGEVGTASCSMEQLLELVVAHV